MMVIKEKSISYWDLSHCKSIRYRGIENERNFAPRENRRISISFQRRTAAKDIPESKGFIG